MSTFPSRLTVENLTVERGGRLVLHGLSAAADATAALVVTGPNGAGKSTLLRTIAGLLHATSGTIRLENGDPELTVAEQCHYFGHQDGLKSALTVKENLAFWLAYYGRSDEGEGNPRAPGIDAALAEVGLDHLIDLPAAYLSAGQRRRLSFARLLISHRPLWLLDEPTSALDAQSELRLVELMNRHLGRGGIIVAATHAPLGFDRRHSLVLGHASADGFAEGTP